jgi:hypothetical protein
MNKYFFYKINTLTNKVSLINKGDKKTELSKEVNKTLKNQDKYQIILLKIEKVKKWNPKIPTNILGGPIKLSFTFFDITKKLKIKKKEDKRAIQIVYYTLEYYEKNNIKLKDLKKVAELAFLNKLEKRLLAPKLITQIKL